MKAFAAAADINANHAALHLGPGHRKRN
jgi:hypothetical protein